MHSISSHNIGTCDVDMPEGSRRPVISEAPRCNLILTFLSRSIPGKKTKEGRHVSSKAWKMGEKRTPTPHIGSCPTKQKPSVFQRLSQTGKTALSFVPHRELKKKHDVYWDSGRGGIWWVYETLRSTPWGSANWGHTFQDQSRVTV